MKIRQHYKELVIAPLRDASLGVLHSAADRITDSLGVFGYSFEHTSYSAAHLQHPECTYSLEHAHPDGVPFRMTAFDRTAGSALFTMPERISLWASRKYGYSRLAIAHFVLITDSGDVVFISLSQLKSEVYAFIIPDDAVSSLYLEFVFNHADLLKDNGQGSCTDDDCLSDAWVPLNPNLNQGK